MSDKVIISRPVTVEISKDRKTWEPVDAELDPFGNTVVNCVNLRGWPWMRVKAPTTQDMLGMTPPEPKREKAK